jgi:hypothetical protein
MALTTHLPPSVEVKARVKLYLQSLYVPTLKVTKNEIYFMKYKNTVSQ